MGKTGFFQISITTFKNTVEKKIEGVRKQESFLSRLFERMDRTTIKVKNKIVPIDGLESRFKNLQRKMLGVSKKRNQKRKIKKSPS